MWVRQIFITVHEEKETLSLSEPSNLPWTADAVVQYCLLMRNSRRLSNHKRWLHQQLVIQVFPLRSVRISILHYFLKHILTGYRAADAALDHI